LSQDIFWALIISALPIAFNSPTNGAVALARRSSLEFRLHAKNSMFDIFTITNRENGSTQFVISVSRLRQALEIAQELSRLFPGQYFGYFERMDDVEHIESSAGRRVEMLTN